MRIYLVGSHCTGKTTLGRYISKKYNMSFITEVARTILAEKEISLPALRADVDATDGFQREVFSRHIEAEYAARDHFVSDRSLDILAYAAEHSTITNHLVNGIEFPRYLDWVREGTTFFVRPQKQLLREDGVREVPTYESVLRIDGMVKLLLEMFNIPYVLVDTPSAQERARLVEAVLRERFS